MAKEKISDLTKDMAGEQALAALRKLKGTSVPSGTYGGDNAKRSAKKSN